MYIYIKSKYLNISLGRVVYNISLLCVPCIILLFIVNGAHTHFWMKVTFIILKPHLFNFG